MIAGPKYSCGIELLKRGTKGFDGLLEAPSAALPFAQHREDITERLLKAGTALTLAD